MRRGLVAALYGTISATVPAPVIAGPVPTILACFPRNPVSHSATSADLRTNGAVWSDPDKLLFGSPTFRFNDPTACLRDRLSPNSMTLMDNIGDTCCVEAWVNVSQAGAVMGWWTGQTVVSQSWRLEVLNGTTIRFVARGINSSSAESTITLDAPVPGVNLLDGQWHHIAAQVRNNLLEAYIDGIRSTTTAAFARRFRVASSPNTYTPFIGGFEVLASSVGNGMIGWIADVRVTRTARYTANFDPPTARIPKTSAGDSLYSSTRLIAPLDELGGFHIVGSQRSAITSYPNNINNQFESSIQPGSLGHIGPFGAAQRPSGSGATCFFGIAASGGIRIPINGDFTAEFLLGQSTEAQSGVLDAGSFIGDINGLRITNQGSGSATLVVREVGGTEYDWSTGLIPSNGTFRHVCVQRKNNVLKFAANGQWSGTQYTTNAQLQIATATSFNICPDVRGLACGGFRITGNAFYNHNATFIPVTDPLSYVTA